jgi:hypothetical protein
MTDIIRLPDNEGHKRPVNARVYAVSKDNDEVIAIEKFYLRTGRVPDTAYLWRGNLYIPEDK